MREILSRAKRVDNEKWVEGHLIYKYEKSGFYIATSNGWTPSHHNPDEGECTIYHSVKSDTIGQYIGCCDSGENKIFDGDVLFSDGENYVVKWHEDDAMFVAEGSISIENFSWIRSTDFLVIGNIHDNPELLEVSE